MSPVTNNLLRVSGIPGVYWAFYTRPSAFQMAASTLDASGAWVFDRAGGPTNVFPLGVPGPSSLAAWARLIHDDPSGILSPGSLSWQTITGQPGNFIWDPESGGKYARLAVSSDQGETPPILIGSRWWFFDPIPTGAADPRQLSIRIRSSKTNFSDVVTEGTVDLDMTGIPAGTVDYWAQVEFGARALESDTEFWLGFRIRGVDSGDSTTVLQQRYVIIDKSSLALVTESSPTFTELGRMPTRGYVTTVATSQTHGILRHGSGGTPAPSTKSLLSLTRLSPWDAASIEWDDSGDWLSVDSSGWRSHDYDGARELHVLAEGTSFGLNRMIVDKTFPDGGDPAIDLSLTQDHPTSINLDLGFVGVKEQVL